MNDLAAPPHGWSYKDEAPAQLSGNGESVALGEPWPTRDDSVPVGGRLFISSPEHVARSSFAWQGAAAEIVQITGHQRVDLRFRAPQHLIILHERGARCAGDTLLQGLAGSSLRDFARKLTFVPAGHDYHEWVEPRSVVRLICFYFDPARVGDMDVAGDALAPRLFFENEPLLESMRKLRAPLEVPSLRDHRYFEALGEMLMHELMRVGRRTGHISRSHGGLASWQQRVVTAYIDQHLSESIRLTTLASLARLSSYHFCRAFKQTFGMPPHRYHTARRIEGAKDLLAQGRQSITCIGLMVGYSETSSFTAAFRKATGLTPTAYRRHLG